MRTYNKKQNKKQALKSQNNSMGGCAYTYTHSQTLEYTFITFSVTHKQVVTHQFPNTHITTLTMGIYPTYP